VDAGPTFSHSPLGQAQQRACPWSNVRPIHRQQASTYPEPPATPAYGCVPGAGTVEVFMSILSSARRTLPDVMAVSMKAVA
jgi:hypothetical protein